MNTHQHDHTAIVKVAAYIYSGWNQGLWLFREATKPSTYITTAQWADVLLHLLLLFWSLLLLFLLS